MVRPLDRRVQLVTGKGGTGKTTLVAALALARAARGKKPLAVELGHRASLPRVLGVAAVSHDVREVLPGVYATNIDVRRATIELVQRVIPSRFTARALRAGPLRTFLDAAPGAAEVATLDRLRHFVDETDFDPILIDGDATGHTRMLFALHDVLGGLGVAGPVAAILDRTSGVFANDTLAAVHVTTLPTSLAIEETLELWNELGASGRIALGHVFLDRVEGVDTVDVAALDALEVRVADRSPSLASALALLRSDHASRDRAKEHGATLRRRGIEVIEVAELDGPDVDPDALRALGLRILEGAAA